MKIIYRIKSHETHAWSVAAVTLFFLLSSMNVFSQVGSYIFSQSAGTFNPISGGTLLGSTTSDDQYFVTPVVPLGGSTTTGIGFPIGFTFNYNSTPFDVIGINNNGWISFGQSSLSPSVNMSSTSAYTSLASTSVITPSTLRNRVAGVNADIQAQVGASLRIETIGSAPNRTCVIQWTNYKRFSTAGTGHNLTFQIRLNEAGGVASAQTIEIVYGTMIFNATTSFAHVGLSGTVNTDFNTRATGTNWNTTVAGTQPSSTNTTSNACQFNTATTAPVSGTTFTWTPGSCGSPGSVTASNFTSSSATVSWTPGSNASYSWELRTSGACGSGAPLQSGTTASLSVNLTGLSVGVLYTFCVRTDCGGGNFSNFASLVFGLPPANDEPCGAIELTVGAACSFTPFSWNDATASAGIPAPGCASYLTGDVWFKFVAPANGSVSIDGLAGSITDQGMAWYRAASGSCGTNNLSLTLIECDDDDSNNGLMSFIQRSDLIPGETIYVRVWAFNDAVTGSLSLCAFSPQPAVNDNPCGAVPLTVGTSCSFTPFSWNNATATAGVPDPGCASYSTGDVWFTAVVPSVGQLKIDGLAGSITDEGMAWYRVASGSCGTNDLSLALIECDDDDSNNGLMSFIQRSDLIPGETIYVRIWAFNDATSGSLSLCAYYEPCPAPTNFAATTTASSASLTFTCTVCPGTFNIEYGLNGFTPGTGTLISGATSPQLITGLASGTTYQAYLQRDCGPDGLSLVVGPLTFTTAAANDACADAITISCASSPVSGTTTGAASDAAILPACGPLTTFNSPGVWYKYVGDNSYVTLSTCDPASNFDTRISVFTGACTGLTCVTANDDVGSGCAVSTLRSQVSFNAIAGTEYLIYVDGFSTASGNFVMSVVCAALCTPVPANETCATAQSLTMGALAACSGTAGSTQCGSMEMPPPSCLSSFQTFPDAWYSFTASQATHYLTVTAGTASSVAAAIYNACGTSTTMFCTASGGSNLSVSGFTVGNTYYIRVLTPQTGPGTFNVCIAQDCPTDFTFTGLETDYCFDASEAELIPAVPGGVFTGDGVLEFEGTFFFSPSSVTPGQSYTITYEYGTCGSSSQETFVHAAPNVTLAQFPTACSNGLPFQLTQGSPAGGTYIGDGIIAGVFDPAAAGAGAHTIFYVFTDEFGCSSFDTEVLTVVASTLSVDAGADEITYFGFTADQTVNRTASVSGGTGPYMYSWTLLPYPETSGERALICNSVNGAGDETFTISGGSGSPSCSNNVCSSSGSYPGAPAAAAAPVCSGVGFNKVTLKLVDSARVVVTVTDANGCIDADTFIIRAEDVRCFAGNSGVEKITICHMTGNNKSPCAKMCIDESSWAAHEAHGDHLGACPANCVWKEDEGSFSHSHGDLTIYPNPNAGVFVIELDENLPMDSQVDIEIMNMVGQTVYVSHANVVNGMLQQEVKFDQDITAGTYFVRVMTQDKVFTGQIIYQQE